MFVLATGGMPLSVGQFGYRCDSCELVALGYSWCHTPVLRNRTEASIRVPRMFKSHAWQQYDKQMKCYK
jgi:hypothetical protein